LLPGGAIWTANNVTFDGAVNFWSNWVGGAGLPPQAALYGSGGAVYGSGGAVYAEGDSTLAFGGPATFRNNSAATGGAITLGARGSAKPRMKFAASSAKSSSCWVGNYAAKSAGGAALRIEAGCRAEFGTLATHNFGSNIAGALSSSVQNDVVVMAQ
jgi:hypothetical protein